MNKPILILTLAGFMLGSVITSCNQSSSEQDGQ